MQGMRSETKAILEFHDSFMADNGRPPTMDEYVAKLRYKREKIRKSCKYWKIKIHEFPEAKQYKDDIRSAYEEIKANGNIPTAEQISKRLGWGFSGRGRVYKACYDMGLELQKLTRVRRNPMPNGPVARAKARKAAKTLRIVGRTGKSWEIKRSEIPDAKAHGYAMLRACYCCGGKAVFYDADQIFTQGIEYEGESINVYVCAGCREESK